jgi:NTP pyrophosphatase (non-canonical NTP hydrolase)
MNQLKLTEITEIVMKIVSERDWQQFHTIKNLITNLVCESTELMEPFIWLDDQDAENLLTTVKRENVEDEIGDVFMTLIMICEKTNIDLEQALLNKMKKIEKKYPVEKSKGKNLKYTEL